MPAYVDSTIDGSAAAVATPAVPSGLSDGDMLIAIHAAWDSAVAAVLSAPAGWTQLSGETGTGTAGEYWAAAVYYKLADSESGTYSFGDAANNGNIAAVAAYTGVQTADLIDAYSDTAYTTSDATVRAAGVTTTEDDGMLVALATNLENKTLSGVPTGMTLRENGTRGGQWVAIADVVQATAGASGNKDFDVGDAITRKHAFLVALYDGPPAGTGTPPVVALVAPEDGDLFPGGVDLMPTFVFGTADADDDPVHVRLRISEYADYSSPIIDTNSLTDYADWEEAEPPSFDTWTTMTSAGAAAGNRVRYKAPTPFRYDSYFGRVRLWDGNYFTAYTEFDFAVAVDPALRLSVTIGGTSYGVGVCRIVETTGGEASPIALQIDIDAYLANPISDADTVAIASGLGNHNRTWNATVEPWTFNGALVDIPALQDDAYLSRLVVVDDYTSADLGAQLAAIIGDVGTLTATNVDTATGVSAAVAGKFKYAREHLVDFIKVLPAYIPWVDSGGDLHFVDQGDLPTPTVCLYEDDPSGTPVTIPEGMTGVRILPGAAPQVGTLDRANKVYCIVEGSSPLVVGSATNTTVAPTFAQSPRIHVMTVKSGDASFCNTVAAAQLAFLQERRYRLNNIPVELEDGLGILRGTAVHVIIPRAGIDTTSGTPYPVRRLEHDWGSAITSIDVGEYAAPRDDPDALFAVAAALEQLKKDTVI